MTRWSALAELVDGSGHLRRRAARRPALPLVAAPRRGVLPVAQPGPRGGGSRPPAGWEAFADGGRRPSRGRMTSNVWTRSRPSGGSSRSRRSTHWGWRTRSSGARAHLGRARRREAARDRRARGPDRVARGCHRRGSSARARGRPDVAIGAERRLAKLEAALGPKELVLHWLAEAHAYDDFVAYARSTYALGPDGLPLDRLIHETIDWVEATLSRPLARRPRRSATYGASAGPVPISPRPEVERARSGGARPRGPA